jgi:hypothetical protein
LAPTSSGLDFQAVFYCLLPLSVMAKIMVFHVSRGVVG